MSTENAATPSPLRKKYVRAVARGCGCSCSVSFGLVCCAGRQLCLPCEHHISRVVQGLSTGQPVSYENYFYQYMFLAHLVLGIVAVASVHHFRRCHI
jgi:hypothetical protein